MSEREQILEVIRSREALLPEPVIAFTLQVLNGMSSASLIEQYRNCLSILAARVAEIQNGPMDEVSSYAQWIAGMQEILEAHLASVKEAANYPGTRPGEG
jgi:hypothetical protein